MKFNSEWLKALVQGDESPLEPVEESEWEDGGKYQHKEYIFKYEGKFYTIDDCRSGSYYSDYYYESGDWEGEIECPEVEQVEKIVKEWQVIK